MIPYYTIFALLLLFATLDASKEAGRLGNIWLGASAILLACFAGLRKAGVGFDDQRYVRAFYEVPPIGQWLSGSYSYSWEFIDKEPLYVAVGALIRQFTNDYMWLFLIMAIISVVMTVINYRKYSPMAGFSIVIYYSHTFLYRDMNQIRSGVAAAIGLFLIGQLTNKRRFRALTTIGIASLFHMGALSFLLPFAISFLRMTRAMAIGALVLGVVLGVVGFAHVMVQALPDIGIITEKVERYYQSQYSYNLGLLDITNIKNIFLLLAMICTWNDLKRKSIYFPTIAMFFALATFWRLAMSDFAIIAGRIATYFSIVEPIIVVMIAVSIRPKNLGLILVSVYAFAMLVLNLTIRDTPKYMMVLFQ